MFFKLPEIHGFDVCWLCEGIMISNLCINQKCRANYDFYWDEKEHAVFCSYMEYYFDNTIIIVHFKNNYMTINQYSNSRSKPDKAEKVTLTEDILPSIKKKILRLRKIKLLE